MASFRELRPTTRRLAEAGRGRVLPLASPTAPLTAAVAVAAACLLLVSQLAGQREEDGLSSTPLFLAKALGAPQTSAPVAWKPRPGVVVRTQSGGYVVERRGRSVSLVSTARGGRPRHFRNGTRRTTAFGSETVTIDSARTEQFLTVTKRQGRKTWTWRLSADGLRPALRNDGAIAFRGSRSTAPFTILPARILDAAGDEVTPRDTRWSLQRRGEGWLLVLELDDAQLPLPYVIDPAADYPDTFNLRNTATSVAGAWDMDGGSGAADATTITQPCDSCTGWWEFDPGTTDNTQLTSQPSGESDQGWIVDAGANNGSTRFEAGTWTFTVKTDVVGNATGGTAYLTYGMWKGNISGTAFVPTQTLIPIGDDTGTNIVATTEPQTFSVSASVGQFGLAAGETIYVQFWRHQTVGYSGSTPRRQVSFEVNSGAANIAHPPADDGAPTVTYSLESRSPAGSTFLAAGSTIYYRGTGGGSGGSFRIRSTVTDSVSGPGSSSTMDTLSSGGWTHTASTVSSPVGGPFDSDLFTWSEGAASSPTERVYASDDAGNNSSTTTFTLTDDSTGPAAPVTAFPVSSGAYTASTWNTGCATNGFCGTVGTDGGSGLRQVELSIRRDSNGDYWDGSGFNPGPEVFQPAGTTWGYSFPASNFPADGSYTVQVRSVDNVNNTTDGGTFTFTYDNTPPAAPTITGSTPASPSNVNDPELTGSAELGSTVKLYTTSDCSGAPLATDTAANFASPGITVTVSDNSSTTFYATATDAAVSPCSSGFTYQEDSVAPGEPTTLGTNPASPSNSNDPKITGSADLDTTVNIYTSADCSGAIAASGSGATFGGAGIDVPDVPSNSSTTYSAKAVDAAGNASICSAAVTYVEDSTAPSAPTGLATSPASPSSNNNPNVTGSAEAGSTVRVYTTGDCSGAATATGSADAFTSPGLAVSLPNDATTTLKATATDAAGNPSTCSAGVAYVEDSTDPSSAFMFPSDGATYDAGSWNDFGGTADDGSGSGVQRVELSIRRDATGLYWNGTDFSSASEDWRTATGTSSWSYAFAVSSFVADGSYRVRLRAVDQAGNTESDSSRVFTIDRAAPNTQIDSAPTNPTNNQDATFALSADESGVTYECSLGSGWSPCTSPKTYTGLTQGTRTFEARATDAVGNVDATPALHTWTIDLTNPAATISFPADGSSYNAATWDTGCSPSGFCGTASDAGGGGLLRVEVSIRRDSSGLYWDGSGFTSASESWRTASGTSSWNLGFAAAAFGADGDYTVRVRAVDNASNTSTPLSRTFTVDTVPPQTSITASPANPTNNANASFSFSADQSGSTFRCRIDAGTWTSCTTPQGYSSLANGSHTFDVYATDPGGNDDPTPATHAWVVDTIPPAAQMNNPGAYLRGTVTLTANTSDTGGSGIASVTFERAAAGSGGPWTVIPASWNTTTAPDGLYDMHVVATDNAGNETTSTAVTNVRVDNTPPAAVMDNPGANVAGTVNLTHSSSDAGSGIDTVQFQYMAASESTWVNTGATWDTTVLVDGMFDLRVIITDRAGNTAGSSSVAVRVDNTPPTVAFADPLDGGFINAADGDPATVRATAEDTGSGVEELEFFACSDASVDCETGTWNSLGVDNAAPYAASWALPATDGPRALKVAARDKANHQSTEVILVTIDRLLPDTNLLTNPGNPSNFAAPTFAFNSTEPGSTFECRIDAGAWGSCVSPYTTPALADGTHTFEVRATDAAGNIDGTPAAWTWLVDTTAPLATMDDPGANLRLIVNLTSSQSDPGPDASGIASVEYEYSVADTDTWVGTETPWDTIGVTDGLYDLRVLVTDLAGNVTQSIPVEDRRIDNTPPATSLDDPGANLRQTVNLLGQATDDGSGVAQVEFQISPIGASSWTAIGLAAAAPYQLSFDTTTYADGLYDFRTVATDVAGNMTEGTPVISRRIDNTPPIAIMNDPGSPLRGTVNLTSTADDPGGSGVSSVVYEYTAAGGGAWQPASASWATSSVPDGSYDLHVIVRDVAGNETISAPVGSRLVDNTAPTTTDNAPSGWQPSAVTVSLSAGDGSGSGVSNTQYAVDGGGYVSGSSVTISSDGIHTISYFSTDVAGNVESPRTATVMIDTTPPDPGANDPGNYLSGTVTLSANPSGSGAPIESVEFQYGQSGTYTSIGVDTTSPYSVEWNTTSVPDGSYDLRFIVREETVPPRQTTVDMPSKIVDNTPPTASVGSPLNGAIVSGDVTIGVTAFDDNPIASVEFFVRGNSIGTSTTAPFQKTWDSASAGDGPASIYVTVTDMAGHTTTSGSITVMADNFAPEVSIASPGAAVRGTVTLGASADGDTVQVAFERRPAGGSGWTSLGTDTAAPWDATFDTTLVADGDYDLRAQATDAGGNSSTSPIVTTKVDNTNPSGALTQPGDGNQVGGTAQLKANASDAGSGVASVAWQARQSGGGSYATIASDGSAPYEGTWDVSGLPSGPYDLLIVVSDGAGNQFTTLPITVDVDATPPTVTLDNPGSPLSGTVTLTASAAGDHDRVTFAYTPAGAASWTAISTDGTPPYSATFNTTTLSDGLYDLRATVYDAVGNSNESVVAGVRIDNFVPVIASSVPANGSIVASANSITITATEDIASLANVKLNGVAIAPNSISGATATFNTGALADGAYTLSGTVTDAVGKSSPFSISFVVGVPPAPAPGSEAPPSDVFDPLTSVRTPSNFRGWIEDDGSLTLAWTPATDADGNNLATILYVDGVATQSFAPHESGANLGPFDPADMRRFSIAAVDSDGNVSGTTSELRSTSTLSAKPLADVEAILANRGFQLGEVRSSGTVVVEPRSAQMVSVGSKVDVELGEPQAPQTRLVFSIVGTKTYSPKLRRYIAVRAKVTRAAQVTTTLLNPQGSRVYRWRFRVKSGTSILRLTMPQQIRRAGRYRLVFNVQAGREAVKRALAFQVAGKVTKQKTPSRKPVEIILAGNSHVRKEIALGLDDGMRVLAAADADAAFGITGSGARNVQVIVVDVDRYGLQLVRDLRTVFPSVRIVALTNDPRKLAQSVRAGAAVAVPRSTPPRDLAKIIARLARKSS